MKIKAWPNKLGYDVNGHRFVENLQAGHNVWTACIFRNGEAYKKKDYRIYGWNAKTRIFECGEPDIPALIADCKTTGTLVNA